MDAFYRSVAYSLHTCRECIAFKAQLHKMDLSPKGCYYHLGTTAHMWGCKTFVCCNRVDRHGIMHRIYSSMAKNRSRQSLLYFCCKGPLTSLIRKIWDLLALFIVSMTSPVTVPLLCHVSLVTFHLSPPHSTFHLLPGTCDVAPDFSNLSCLRPCTSYLSPLDLWTFVYLTGAQCWRGCLAWQASPRRPHP